MNTIKTYDKGHTYRFIGLNGGKGCGKTTLVNQFFKNAFGNDSNLFFKETSCKTPLIDLLCSVFGISHETFNDLYKDWSKKESPIPLLIYKTSHLPSLNQTRFYNWLQETFGDNWKNYYCEVTGECGVIFSIRQAMIFVSEYLMKPTFGEGVFGSLRAKNIRDYIADLNDITTFNTYHNVFYDDSTASFKGECAELEDTIKLLGGDNVHIIRIKGRGNFDNDSRGYIEEYHAKDIGFKLHTIDYDGTIPDLFNKAEGVLSYILRDTEWGKK